MATHSPASTTNPSSANPVVQLESVSVKKQGNTLLSEAQLRVHAGEIHALIGPNGAGKTSLLNVISGDVPTASGNLLIHGKTRQAWPPQALARHLAVLPQHNDLRFPYLVEQVVALGRIPHQTGQQCDQTIVTEAMRELDILHLKQTPYTRLSGGEKQRTQLARVLAQIWREEDASPRLLLLDEPSTALDLGHQQHLMHTLKKHAENKVAIIMVVHDLTLALQHASHISALKNGKIIASGSTETLASAELFSQVFDTPIHLMAHPDTGKKVAIL